MSHVESAESILNNPTPRYEDSYKLVQATRAQVHATLALAEAQQTANLIAFLEWSNESPSVSRAEYMDVIKQVKERIK